MKQAGCELCASEGGRLVLANEYLRVVLVDDPAFPGFARVIWNAHVREMTDLDDAAQQRLMRTVFAVERAQRDALRPAKVNIASLGNMTPHLHWHVVPRFEDDSHFPHAVWGPAQREADTVRLAERRDRLDGLRRRIAEEVARVGRD